MVYVNNTSIKLEKIFFKEVNWHCNKEQSWAVYELAENVSCYGRQRKHALHGSAGRQWWFLILSGASEAALGTQSQK